MDSVIRPEIRNIVGEAVISTTDQLVRFSKALHAFNNLLMPNIIAWSIENTVNAFIVEQIYDSMVEVAVSEQMVMISQDDINHEQEIQENSEKEKAFGEYLDSLILDSCLKKISREYEAEETVRLKKEAASKGKRDMLAAKKRQLKEDTKAKQLLYIKDDELTQFNKAKALIKPAIRSVISTKPGPEENPDPDPGPENQASRQGTAENGLKQGKAKVVATKFSKSLAPSMKDPKEGSQAASQMSLQDAVKERLKLQGVEKRTEPQNPLENMLMGMHS